MIATTTAIIASLYKWQTLLSGLIALVAAYVGWRAVRKQISHADLQVATARQQRFIAERAGLVHVLTQISKYSDDCMAQTSSVLARLTDGKGQEKFTRVLSGMLPGFGAPSLPNDIVPELKACMEYACDEFGGLIASLLIDLQVQQSRIQSLWRDVKDPQHTVVSRHSFESAFLDAASIKGHADNLYKYARFQTNEIPRPLDWETVINTLAPCSGSHLTGAFELLKLRQQNDKSPQLVAIGPLKTN